MGTEVYPQSVLVLHRFVGLQLELSNAFQQSLSEGKGWVEPSHISREKVRGTLEFSSEQWEYRCHGGGVCFTRKKPRMVVEMHQWLHMPEIFDIWRIHLHLVSIRWKGEQGTSLDQRQYLKTMEGAEDWLRTLKHVGIIKKVPDLPWYYQLNIPLKKLSNINF